MRCNVRFVAFFLLASAAAFAQRGGGFGGGGFRGGAFTTGSGFRSGSFISPGLRGSRAFVNGRGFAGGRRFGRNFLFPFYPFYPFLDDYSDWAPPPESFAPIGDSAEQSCSSTAMVQPPPAPVVPAHPVIHDYNWNDQSSPSGTSEGTFTIALKDGSQRSAVTAWVEDRSLHYIDAQDRQAVVSSDVIDRDTTQRLNREKNLHLQLPPG